MKSMTGYSRQEAETGLGKLTVEIKSWNHRYCNVLVKLPESLSRFETQIQATVRDQIARGQIQVAVALDAATASLAQTPKLNLTLAKAYYQTLRQLKAACELEDEVSLALLTQLPDVLTVQGPDMDEDTVWQELQTILAKALVQLNGTRSAEGSAMGAEIENRCQLIQAQIEAIRASSVDLVSTARERLEKRLHELLDGQIELDPSRLIMEAGIIAARSDITEELVRLDSHCVQLGSYLNASEPVGRQLDFLMQEMNREVNTIASKAGQASISAACVTLKTEIEKIRELAQNVE